MTIFIKIRLYLGLRFLDAMLVDHLAIQVYIALGMHALVSL